MMTKLARKPAELNTLEEIKLEQQEICTPRYHEYYRDVHQYGFSKITIPKERT